MNLVESVPPKVSSPLVDDSLCVGSNETATSCAVITPCVKRLSVTVGRWETLVSARSHGLRKSPRTGNEVVGGERRHVLVGMVELVSGERVSTVRSTGPMLSWVGAVSVRCVRGRRGKRDAKSGEKWGRSCEAYPMIPSTPSKPVDLDATPMDWAVTVKPPPRVTVSVNSVPMRNGEVRMSIRTGKRSAFERTGEGA